MTTEIEVVFENGVFRPLNEADFADLKENHRYTLIVEEAPTAIIDLAASGIERQQAAELRVRLQTFGDWESEEMNIYDDYDAAKSAHEGG